MANESFKTTLGRLIKKLKNEGYLSKTLDESTRTMGELREFITGINQTGRHYFFDLHNYVANAYVCLIRCWSENDHNYCEINDLLNHQLIGTPNMIYEDDMTIYEYASSYKKKYATQDEIDALNERIDSIDTEAKVYGIRFFGTGTTGTRLNNSANLDFNLAQGINDFDAEPFFASIHEVETQAYNSAGVALVDNTGAPLKNKFIYFPNFYFKETRTVDSSGNDVVSWYVTAKERAGFIPYFKNADGTIPSAFLVGKYETALGDDTEAVVGSFTGKKPAVNVNRDWMQARTTYALDPSLGINTLRPVDQSFPKKAWDAVAILISIVIGTRHHQSVFYGITGDSTYNPADAANLSKQPSGAANWFAVPKTNYIRTKSVVGDMITIFSSSSVAHRWEEHEILSIEDDVPEAGYSKILFAGNPKIMNSGTVRIALHAGELTGKTDDIPSEFGNISTDTYHAFKAFGIENYFGNFWTILGGAAIELTWNTDEAQAHNKLMVPNGDDYTVNASYTTFHPVEVELAQNDGYVKRLDFYEGIMVPSITANGASSTTYYADYYYQNHKSGPGSPEYRTFLGGGYCYNGAYAGSFSFHCSGGWTYSNYNCGFRSFLLIQ